MKKVKIKLLGFFSVLFFIMVLSTGFTSVLAATFSMSNDPINGSAYQSEFFIESATENNNYINYFQETNSTSENKNRISSSNLATNKEYEMIQYEMNLDESSFWKSTELYSKDDLDTTDYELLEGTYYNYYAPFDFHDIANFAFPTAYGFSDLDTGTCATYVVAGSDAHNKVLKFDDNDASGVAYCKAPVYKTDGTIEFYTRETTTASWAFGLYKGSSTIMSFYTSGGNLYAWYYGAPSLIGAFSINTWYHVALKFSCTEQKVYFYLDGVYKDIYDFQSTQSIVDTIGFYTSTSSSGYLCYIDALGVSAFSDYTYNFDTTTEYYTNMNLQPSVIHCIYDNDWNIEPDSEYQSYLYSENDQIIKENDIYNHDNVLSFNRKGSDTYARDYWLKKDFESENLTEGSISFWFYKNESSSTSNSQTIAFEIGGYSYGVVIYNNQIRIGGTTIDYISESEWYRVQIDFNLTLESVEVFLNGINYYGHSYTSGCLTEGSIFLSEPYTKSYKFCIDGLIYSWNGAISRNENDYENSYIMIDNSFTTSSGKIACVRMFYRQDSIQATFSYYSGGLVDYDYNYLLYKGYFYNGSTLGSLETQVHIRTVGSVETREKIVVYLNGVYLAEYRFADENGTLINPFDGLNATSYNSYKCDVNLYYFSGTYVGHGFVKNSLSYYNQPFTKLRLLSNPNQLPEFLEMPSINLEVKFTAPQEPDTRTNYWTYWTSQIAFDEYELLTARATMDDGTEVDFSYNYTLAVVDLVEARFYYYTIDPVSWGDWGFFNILRDAVAFILNLVLLSLQFIVYFLLLAFNYIFMYIVVGGLLILVWNILLKYLLWAGLWLLVGIYLLIFYVLPPVISWIFNVLFPLLIDIIALVLTAIFATLIYLFSFGLIPYDDIFEIISTFITQVADFIYTFVMTILEALPTVFLYTFAYIFCVYLIYIRYYFCKARGFKNRAENLYTSYESYLKPAQIVGNTLKNWLSALKFW